MLLAVRLLGDMPTFTGYEPNNLVGKGPGHTTQTTGSASSSSAAQQLVPADTLGDDFDRLFDESMSELFDDPLVPLADSYVLQSGPKGLAASLGPSLDEPAISATAGAPKDVEHHGASIKKQARISADGKPKDDGHHGKPAKQARFLNNWLLLNQTISRALVNQALVRAA